MLLDGVVVDADHGDPKAPDRLLQHPQAFPLVEVKGQDEVRFYGKGSARLVDPDVTPWVEEAEYGRGGSGV